MKWTAEVEVSFCYGHRLLDYEGPCARVHGHNAKVRVGVSTDRLDRTGFVIDFRSLKTVLKVFVDERWDHRTLLKNEVLNDDAAIAIDAVSIPYNPTAENMAADVFGMMLSQFPDVTIEYVDFFETPTSKVRVTVE